MGAISMTLRVLAREMEERVTNKKMMSPLPARPTPLTPTSANLHKTPCHQLSLALEK